MQYERAKPAEEFTQEKNSIQPTAQNCSTIVHAVLLKPHGVFAVFTEYPGLFFVNLTQQVSKFFDFESLVTAVHWDAESAKLFLGH